MEYCEHCRQPELLITALALAAIALHSPLCLDKVTSSIMAPIVSLIHRQIASVGSTTDAAAAAASTAAPTEAAPANAQPAAASEAPKTEGAVGPGGNGGGETEIPWMYIGSEC